MKKNNLSLAIVSAVILGVVAVSSTFADTQVIYLNAGGQSDSQLGGSTTGTSADVSGSADATGSAKSNSSGSASLMLNISGNDARGTMTNGTDSMNMNVSSAAQVESADDLQSYAHVVAMNDSSVDTVTSDNTSVNVVFNRPAKLFGFISVTAKENANVTVDSQGNPVVSVNKPWWSFMASGDFRGDEVANKIKVSLSGMSSSFSASASLTASEEAQILAAIENASASVYATSTANANVQ